MNQLLTPPMDYLTNFLGCNIVKPPMFVRTHIKQYDDNQQSSQQSQEINNRIQQLKKQLNISGYPLHKSTTSQDNLQYSSKQQLISDQLQQSTQRQDDIKNIILNNEVDQFSMVQDQMDIIQENRKQQKINQVKQNIVDQMNILTESELIQNSVLNQSIRTTKEQQNEAKKTTDQQLNDYIDQQRYINISGNSQQNVQFTPHDITLINQKHYLQTEPQNQNKQSKFQKCNLRTSYQNETEQPQQLEQDNFNCQLEKLYQQKQYFEVQQQQIEKQKKISCYDSVKGKLNQFRQKAAQYNNNLLDQQINHEVLDSQVSDDINNYRLQIDDENVSQQKLFLELQQKYLDELNAMHPVIKKKENVYISVDGDNKVLEKHVQEKQQTQNEHIANNTIIYQQLQQIQKKKQQSKQKAGVFSFEEIINCVCVKDIEIFFGFEPESYMCNIIFDQDKNTSRYYILLKDSIRNYAIDQIFLDLVDISEDKQTRKQMLRQVRVKSTEKLVKLQVNQQYWVLVLDNSKYEQYYNSIIQLQQLVKSAKK